MVNENVSLKPIHTFHIEVYARYFASFSDPSSLENLLRLRSTQITAKELLILGGGSNILFTKDYDGLVLKNDILGIEKVSEDSDHVYLKVGAGENWHRFVQYCIERNLAGVENLSLIPGNVGASPMQNIGAYGVEIRDVFHDLEAFHIKSRKIKTFTHADCAFDYRESIFKNKLKGEYIIFSVTFRLNKIPNLNTSYGAIAEELARMNEGVSIQTISQAVINIRTSKLPDPGKIGNAGSFFKNPSISARQY